MRVLTLNLWERSGSWPDRRSVLARGLRGLQPDLLALQEAVVTDDYDQVFDLMGSRYHVVHQAKRHADGSGISIASRWPIEMVQEVDLHVTPRTKGFECSTLLVEIHVPPPIGPLLFVNHKPSWQLDLELERELQAVAAAEAIEGLVSRRDLHVVLVGDLDAVPDSASVRFLSGRQVSHDRSVRYRDAWESANSGYPGHTFSPRNSLVPSGDMQPELGRRIDYIFVRCVDRDPTLDVSACALAFSEPVNGVWASDHFGVVADLTIPTY